MSQPEVGWLHTWDFPPVKCVSGRSALASSANMPALRICLCVSYPGSRQALGLCEEADAKVLADEEALLTEKE